MKKTTATLPSDGRFVIFWSRRYQYLEEQPLSVALHLLLYGFAFGCQVVQKRWEQSFSFHLPIFCRQFCRFASLWTCFIWLRHPVSDADQPVSARLCKKQAQTDLGLELNILISPFISFVSMMGVLAGSFPVKKESRWSIPDNASWRPDMQK